MKPFYLIISVLFLISCNKKKEKEIYEVKVSENTTSIKNKVGFKSYFKIDSSLTKRDSVNITIVSNRENKQRLLSICNCEKNKKKNTIKIQLTSAIPTKIELKNGEKGSRLFMDIGNPGSFKGQIKTLTFFLKDSLIEKIDFILNQRIKITEIWVMNI